MKYLKFITSGLGAVLIPVCFFMPWLSLTRNGVPLGEGTATGMQTVSAGFTFLLLLVALAVCVWGLLWFSAKFPQSARMSGGGQIVLALLGFVVLWIVATTTGDSLIGISRAGFMQALFTNTPVILQGDSFGFTAKWGLYGIVAGLIMVIMGGIATTHTTPEPSR